MFIHENLRGTDECLRTPLRCIAAVFSFECSSCTCTIATCWLDEQAGFRVPAQTNLFSHIDITLTWTKDIMVLQSFIDVPVTSHFSLQNLPYGVFSSRVNPKRRVGVALGSKVVDLSVLTTAGLLNGPHLQNATCFHDVRDSVCALVH